MKAIVFDLDGTLFDSMWIWERLVFDYLNSKGIKAPIGIRDSLKSYSLFEGCKVIKERFGLEDSPEEINKELERVLEDYYRNKIELKQGAFNFIQEMKIRGIKLAVATATVDYLAKAALKRLGIYDDFEFIQTCMNANLEKYDPRFYQLIIERLDVLPEEIIIFEDALHSMEAAKSLGIRVIGIKDKSASADEKKIKKVAEFVADDFVDMDKLIG